MTAGRATRVATLVLVALLGCKSERAAAPPPADAAPAVGSAQVDALADAEAQLAANAAELNALGVKIAWGRDKGEPSKRATIEQPKAEPEPTKTVEAEEAARRRPKPTTPPANVKKPDTTPTKEDPGEQDGDATASTESPCKKICTLAGVACDLSNRICQLADDHEGDARYEDACWNAERQCEDASDACSECTAC